jgi:hypothetical protein
MKKKLSNYVGIFILLFASSCGYFEKSRPEPGPGNDQEQPPSEDHDVPTCQSGKGCINLAWTYPLDEMSKVEKFTVYYGTASREYTSSIDFGKELKGTIFNLEPGRYFFAIIASPVDKAQYSESPMSNEVNSETTIPESGLPSFRNLEEFSVDVE